MIKHRKISAVICIGIMTFIALATVACDDSGVQTESVNSAMASGSGGGDSSGGGDGSGLSGDQLSDGSQSASASDYSQTQTSSVESVSNSTPGTTPALTQGVSQGVTPGVTPGITPVVSEELIRIPPFSASLNSMANTSYKIDLFDKGVWRSVTPYNVRINSNLTQNININDPVQNSPMVYFGIGSSSVTLRINSNSGNIQSAVVQPRSYGIPVQITDGAVVIVLTKPQNICVELNGSRYEQVYVFAHDIKEESITVTDKVRVIPSGITTTPKVGTETWDGGIRDVRIYDRALSASEISSMDSGDDISGYTDRWHFSSNMKNEANQSVTGSVFGSPSIVQGYRGAEGGSFVFNGYEDAFYTSKLFKVDAAEYTLSARVYLEQDGAGAQRVILNHLMFVRSDGTIGSNIGDWQFPYISDIKLTAGMWHNVVLTKKNNSVTVYIDGQNGGTKTRPAQEQSIYFGIGSGTLVNGLYVKSGETLYVSPGAVLKGTVLIYGSNKVNVMGSGMIDITSVSGSTSYSGIVCAYSEDVVIEGPIVNNPSSFNLAVGQSKNISIRNFKCFSSYGASDGINMKSSTDIDIDGCFVRANDDAVSIYATSVGYLGSSSGISVRNTTLISDAGHAVNSGTHAQENGNDTISGISFNNIDVVDSKSPSAEYQGVLSVNAGNDAIIKDFVFSDIRIEDIRINQLFNVRVIYNSGYNKTPGKSIENIEFRNIAYNGSNALPSVLSGYSSTRTVRNVVFDNVTVNGRKLKSGDPEFDIKRYVYDVSVK